MHADRNEIDFFSNAMQFRQVMYEYIWSFNWWKKNLSRGAHKFWCIIIFNTIYGQDCDDDDDDDKRSSSSSWCCKLLQLGTCACARAQSSSPFSISYCLKHVVNALTLICTQNTHTPFELHSLAIFVERMKKKCTRGVSINCST